MTQELFGRQIILQIGKPGGQARVITGLRVSFRVDYKAGKRGKATIVVYNPAQNTQDAALEDGAFIRLLAGYDNPGVIFEGVPLRNGVKTERRGATRLMTIAARSGKRLSNRIELSYNAPVQLSEVVSEVVKVLGLPTGVVRLAQDVLLPGGFQYAGDAFALINRLVNNTGAVASLLDGTFEVLPTTQTSTVEVVTFSSKTRNLIGTPQKRNKGIIEITALLEPRLRPGVGFVVESENINGRHKARDVSFVGDLYSNAFYVKATGRVVR